MFELVTPHAGFHLSYLAAADEFIAAGEERHANLFTWPADDSFPGRSYTRETLKSPVCAGLGIDPALVTCDPDNDGSRRTIDKNGGVYEDTREGKLRFWVPTYARVDTE